MLNPVQVNSNLEHIRIASEYFKIRQWSQDTIRINARGHLEVCLDHATKIDLYSLVEQLKQQGHHCPVLLRFPQLIENQVTRIQQAFQRSIAQTGYANRYTYVYPIKTNPHAGVLRTLGKNPTLGFEAGSKAEFLLLLTQVSKEQLILANGFKDAAYLQCAIQASQQGQRLCLVLETFEETQQLIALSQQQPFAGKLGVRVRLNNTSTGKWSDSNGQYSKFGLSCTELIHTISLLREHGLLQQLNTLHIHPGSQILTLSEIMKCVQECIRYYHEVVTLGANLEFLDIGGGLSVEYSPAGHEEFKNYTIEDYAQAVVEQLKQYCEQHELACPHILSESGRALMAHTSMLITNVIPLKKAIDLKQPAPATEDLPVIHELWNFYLAINNKYHKDQLTAAEKQLERLLTSIKYEFTERQLPLAQLAKAEQLYEACLSLLARKFQAVAKHSPYQQYKYLANFSLFQNIPDHWGIKQFFPLLPLHGFKHALTDQAVFYDLTCDSDGVIRQYLHPQKLQATLKIPGNIEPKYIGIFLLGAYQEILGSRHNLFERPLCVDVTADGLTVYPYCDIQTSFAGLGYATSSFELSDDLLQQLTQHSYLQD